MALLPFVANAQATSLSVDNQTPGWLSSKIGYGDQQTLKNIKVTGYINGTDIQFIYDLNSNRSLTGVIDLEDVSLVSGGVYYINGYPQNFVTDNEMPPSFFYGQKQNIQKFIYPKTLVKAPLLPFPKPMVDSLIWTSTYVKSLDVSNEVGYSTYVFIPEGIEKIGNIPNNTRITLPSTVKEISHLSYNAIIYSFIDNPEQVYAQYESYYSDAYGGHRSYWAAIANSTFYIPKGSMEKYLNSDFAKMPIYNKVNIVDGGLSTNGNKFIEYYDIEKTEITAPNLIYKGETHPTNVIIYPDANFVSKIDYKSSDPEIVSVNNEGLIEAKDYGQVEISATPLVFIDGLETKTGTCLVKVIAHTEGVKIDETLSLHIGEKKEIHAYTLPIDVSDNKIIFSIDDPLTATVSEDGIVTGLKRGTCTITATSVDGGYSAKCAVTVLQPVESVTFGKHETTLKVGETETLYAQVSPSNADNKKLIWTSSDDSKATVSNGVVKALKAGTVKITVTSEDNAEAKDECSVTVIQPVTGIVLSKTSYTLYNIGESVQLVATVQPEDATNKKVNWKSTNESACIVSNGNVVAVGFGTTVIIATTEDGGFMAYCTISVENPTGITEITSGNSNSAPVYDTMGRKVKDVAKGQLYIRQGKKFIAQ